MKVLKCQRFLFVGRLGESSFILKKAESPKMKLKASAFFIYGKARRVIFHFEGEAESPKDESLKVLAFFIPGKAWRILLTGRLGE